MIELRDHPWFVGCQFHPEFKSRPIDCHPLFKGFIRAALQHRRARRDAPLLERAQGREAVVGATATRSRVGADRRSAAARRSR